MSKFTNKLFNFFKRFKTKKATFEDIKEITKEYNIPTPKRNPSENLPSSTLLEPEKMYEEELELGRVNKMLSGEYFNDIAEEKINDMMGTISPFLSDESVNTFESLTTSEKIDFYNVATSQTILGKTESIMYSDTEILNIIYHTHAWDKLYALTDAFDTLLSIFNDRIRKYGSGSESYNEFVDAVEQSGLGDIE